MYMIARTKNQEAIHVACKMVGWADVIFTCPGVFLLISNGIVLATVFGGMQQAPWIAMAYLLFVGSGVIWLVCLIPDQERDSLLI